MPLAMVSNHQSSFWPILILIQRPSTMEEWIRPEDLVAYWVLHKMLGLCCLCPLVDLNAPDFVESAMYRATDSEFLGQFVATCADNRCSYIGVSFQWLVPLYTSWNILHQQCNWENSTRSKAFTSKYILARVSSCIHQGILLKPIFDVQPGETVPLYITPPMRFQKQSFMKLGRDSVL